MFEKIVVVTSDGHAHEYHKKPDKQPITNTRKAIAITALVGAVVGGGAAIGLYNALEIPSVADSAASLDPQASYAKTNNQVSMESAKVNADAVAELKASEYAKSITESLNEDFIQTVSISNPIVTLLNGTISQKITNSLGEISYVPIIRDPILLSTLNDQKPDATLGFMDGARLGVIGKQQTIGTHVDVSVVRFDSSTMKFDPESAESTMQAQIVTLVYNFLGRGEGYETIALDATGSEHLLGGNGREVFVGEDLSK